MSYKVVRPPPHQHTHKRDIVYDAKTADGLAPALEFWEV